MKAHTGAQGDDTTRIPSGTPPLVPPSCRHKRTYLARPLGPCGGGLSQRQHSDAVAEPTLIDSRCRWSGAATATLTRDQPHDPCLSDSGRDFETKKGENDPGTRSLAARNPNPCTDFPYLTYGSKWEMAGPPGTPHTGIYYIYFYYYVTRDNR